MLTEDMLALKNTVLYGVNLLVKFVCAHFKVSLILLVRNWNEAAEIL